MITQIGPVTTSAATATTPAVVAPPSGAQKGDLLLFFVIVYLAGTTITPPAGVTAVSGTYVNHTSGGDVDIVSEVFQIALTSAPAGSYSFTNSASSNFGVICVCLRGVGLASLAVDTSTGAPTTAAGFTDAPTGTGLTPTAAQSFLFLFWAGGGNGNALTTDFPAPFAAEPGMDGSAGTSSLFGTFLSNWGFYSAPNQPASATGNPSGLTNVTADDWAVTILSIAPGAALPPQEGLAYADMVQETTTTTGTGTLTLGGASTGFRTFASAFSDGQVVTYSITDGTNWETGIGQYHAGADTLDRNTVLSSSNSGALVNFPSGTKTVWCDQDAPTVADIGLSLAFQQHLVSQ